MLTTNVLAVSGYSNMSDNLMRRGRGRPKLGNVLFARRVHPSKLPALLAIVNGEAKPPADKNVMKLLADNERLEKENAELLARPKEELNLDYKELYLALLSERGVAKKSEFDQT